MARENASDRNFEALKLLADLRDKSLCPLDHYEFLVDFFIVEILKDNNYVEWRDVANISCGLQSLRAEKGSNMVKNSTFIGGSVTGSAVVTGDHSTITGRFDSTALPPAETVDIANALATFEQTITDLNLPDKGKVTREIAYMHEKAIEEEPDKQLIAAALESTSKYAKTAADFADNAKKIAEAGAPVVAWLGPVGAGLAKMLGLM